MDCVFGLWFVVNYICEGFYRVFLLYKQTARLRGGKSISISGDRGDNGGRTTQINCVGFNLPTRHQIFILMSPTTHKILFIKKTTTHVKKNEAVARPSHTFNSGTALMINAI